MLLLSCDSGQKQQFSSDFESGSPENVVRVSDGAFQIELLQDPGIHLRPSLYRGWWHTRFAGGDLKELRISNRGNQFFYTPVYSYDQTSWMFFDTTQVSLDSGDLVISPDLDGRPVFLARYFPYTYSDLELFLSEVRESPYVKVETLDRSSTYGMDVPLITVRDFSKEPTHVVIVLSRVHPSETGSSYLVEGIVRGFLSEPSDVALFIVPMLNVDGVIEGTHRTNLEGVDLELSWSQNPPKELPEVIDLVSSIINEFPDALVLNLHSSISEFGNSPFGILHFGLSSTEYTSQEVQLHRNQLKLLDEIDGFNRGVGGGRSFLETDFPETWLWNNYGASVTAITLETTYSLTEEEVVDLGRETYRGARNFFLQ